MALDKYKEKRNFKVSPEPSGRSHDAAGSQRDLLYVIQKHRASQLHYELLSEIARGNGGDVQKAATGDPGKIAKPRVPTTAKSPTRKKRAKT